MVLKNTLPKSSITVTRPARGRVPGDGVELAFGYWPGRGAPVVALHGLTASHLNFAGIAERLAGRCALFALDLRGRGDSANPRDRTALFNTRAMWPPQCAPWDSAPALLRVIPWVPLWRLRSLPRSRT